MTTLTAAERACVEAMLEYLKKNPTPILRNDLLKVTSFGNAASARAFRWMIYHEKCWPVAWAKSGTNDMPLYGVSGPRAPKPEAQSRWQRNQNKMLARRSTKVAVADIAYDLFVVGPITGR